MLEVLEQRLAPATFVVNSIGDEAAVDPANSAETSLGSITLRSAIEAANAQPNDVLGPDRIEFSISGSGVQTIAPSSQLPEITDPVFIDGYSQPVSHANTLAIGSDAILLIQLQGDGNASFDGLRISGGGTTVRGLAINQFDVGIRSFNLGGNTIIGNFIGTDADGANALGNSFAGITNNAPDTRIGGTDSADRNLISGNGERGISFSGGGLTIQGNYIGSDRDGATALPNGLYGISAGEAVTAQIGGTAPGAGNLISGNSQYGIQLIEVADTLIQGNMIGTNADGTGGIANGAGVFLSFASNVAIGGTAAGAGNAIAFNAGAGVIVESGVGNPILGNSIHSNGGLGIDLGDDGVTDNDVDDGDSGPNELQNFPVIMSILPSGTPGLVLVQGFLNSKPGTYRIELFVNDAADPSDHGEGQTFLGATDLIIDLGLAEGGFALAVPKPAPGQFLSATATGEAGNTSEFSANFVIAATSADLGVTIFAQSPFNPFTYQIGLTNGGPDAASDVDLTIDVPDGTTFVSFTAPNGFTVTSPGVGGTGTITAHADQVDVDADFQFTLVVQVANPGDIIFATVRVASTTDDPDDSNNEAGDQTQSQAPPTSVDVGVDVSAAAFVDAGATLTYQITVTNDGHAEALDTKLSFDIPADTTFVSLTSPLGWTISTPSVGGTGTVMASIASLGVGGTTNFTLVVQVNAGTPADTEITGRATISTNSPELNPANNEASAITVVTEPVPSANLALTKTAPSPTATLGQPLTFTILVTNNGPNDATNVVVTDTLPAPFQFVSATGGVTPDVNGMLTFHLGTIANGASQQIEILVIPTTLGAVQNSASVALDTSDPDMTDNSDSANLTVASSEVNLGLTKIASAPVVVLGQELTYTLTVSNNGLQMALGVELFDTLPTGVVFVSATGGVTPNDQGVLTFQLGNLTFNQSTQVVIVVLPTAVGSVVNSAEVLFDGEDFDPTDNTASATVEIVVQADLAISMTATPNPVGPGSSVTYTITVTNGGPHSAENVVVSTGVPTNTTFVSFAAPTGWDSTTPNAGETGGITTTISSLASGDSAVFTFTVLVNSGTPGSTTLMANGSVSSNTDDPNHNNDNASASVIVTPQQSDQTDLQISMTASPNPVTQGQNLTFTITVTNNGPIDASTVTMSMSTPGQTSFQSLTAPSGWNTTTPSVGSTGTMSASIATLGAGQSATFTVVVRVNTDATVSSTINGLATIASLTPDSDLSNNSAQAASQVAQALTTNVTVTLVDNIDPATVGQDITYTLTVSNSGDGSATGVVVDLSVPSNVTIMSLGGGTQTVTGVQFIVGTLDSGASQQFQVVIRPVNAGTLTLTATPTADSGVTVGSTVSQSTTVTSGSSNGDTTPPTVQSVVRYGFHAQPTLLVVTFSKAMNATQASNANNYVVVLSPKDDVFGNVDDRVVSISSVYYDSSMNEATLRVSEQIYAFRPFQVVVRASGLTDANGNSLDGNGDGTGGDNYVTTLHLSDLAGRASEAPNANKVGVAALPSGALALAAARARQVARAAVVAQTQAASKARAVTIAASTTAAAAKRKTTKASSSVSSSSQFASATKTTTNALTVVAPNSTVNTITTVKKKPARKLA